MAFNKYDSVIDSPGNNFATWNPLSGRNKNSSSPFLQPTFSEGNKKVTAHASEVTHAIGSIASSGKHYAEFIISGSSPITAIGVISSEWDKSNLQSYIHNFGGAGYTTDGNLYSNGGISDSTVETITTSFRVGIEVDFTANEVAFFRVDSDGTKTQQGSTITTDIDFKNSGTFAASLHNSSEYIEAYFNENEWWGTPNDGYISLCSANLPMPIENPKEYFRAVTWVGDGSPDGVKIQTGFKPDLVWAKNRDTTHYHQIHDSVRGSEGGVLYSNQADGQDPTYSMKSFDADGFTLGSQLSAIHGSGNDIVAWTWKAGGGGGKYNIDGKPYATFEETGLTAGTIEPIGMSVNTKAGFSIVKYSGNGDIPHGLSSPLDLVIIKNLDLDGEGWTTWHSALDSGDYVYLHHTQQKYNSTSKFSGVPTNTVFQVEADNSTGSSSYNYIAYCWHSVPGYSAFGSYTGNGNADGPFVYTGFKPAFMMVKCTTADNNNWVIRDSVRDGYNPNLGLLANESDAELGSTWNPVDILSNGFKVRATGTDVNSTSETYIYMAFAEQPLATQEQKRWKPKLFNIMNKNKNPLLSDSDTLYGSYFMSGSVSAEAGAGYTVGDPKSIGFYSETQSGFGQSLDFANYSKYLSFAGTPPKSISMWIKFKSHNSVGRTYIFDGRTSSTTSNGYWILDSNDKMTVLRTSSGEYVYQGSDWINTWYHLGLVFNDSGLKIYRNGTVLTSNSTAAKAFGSTFYMGAYYNNLNRTDASPDQYFMNAYVDNLFLVNRTLTSSEMMEQYTLHA